LAAPLALVHGTLVCRGTPVGKHWSRVLLSFRSYIIDLFLTVGSVKNFRPHGTTFNQGTIFKSYPFLCQLWLLSEQEVLWGLDKKPLWARDKICFIVAVHNLRFAYPYKGYLRNLQGSPDIFNFLNLVIFWLTYDKSL